LFSGFNSVSTVPAGSAAKPSLVGAKTVKGPGELKVSAKSPATTAVTKVDKSSTDCANSTMLGVAIATAAEASAATTFMVDFGDQNTKHQIKS